MKKIILVDGNNLMFRSYYATAYTGNIMKNSKGLPTNALYGFVSMINKIIEEEKPNYMAVAFDIGTNFRKVKYSFYKDGRSKTPDELKEQMPIARKILDAMNIKYIEQEPFEADDIIGTIVNMTESDKDYTSTIISSDKDLLQLISDETEIKLLKQTGFIRYNKSSFIKDYGIEPIKIIDLKALMGDASDNIPGVKGIGEKTALKLLQEYGSLENIYDNIDLISGKVKEKLVSDKENAFMSKDIATIYKNIDLGLDLEELKVKEVDDSLTELYQELEFYSLLKNMNVKKEENKIEYKTINNINELDLNDEVYIYLELDNYNYHLANILGMSLISNNNYYFINKELVLDVLALIKDKKIYTYDAKKIMVKSKIIFNNIIDIMISSYVNNYNLKDDIAYLMNQFNEEVIFYDNLIKDQELDKKLAEELIKKVSFIYNYKDELLEKLEENNCSDLFYNIEMPLVKVLSDMEITGISVNKNVLDEMKLDVKEKIDKVSSEIYSLVGMEFNISSPKQLGEILFEKLEISKGKKNKTGYKTDVKELEKLVDKHPVIAKILEYRNLTKLYSTYIEGLENYILEDGKIHTIYKQTLTRTGRISSVEPNLQNIPVREELGRNIRKAFLPSFDYLLSADYSQIELRVLAHIAGSKTMINAFLNDEDIHSKVASDIYGIDIKDVTKDKRRTAKAVIFGIVYGISGFGLKDNLKITKKEADEFINKYYEMYPEIKKYMDDIIKKTHETGYVKTMFGRIRNIDEIKNNNYMIRQMGERMALNTPIQGTSADLMKMAMINVYNRFIKEKIDSKILLQVHDEIVIDVKENELEKVKVLVKEEMENVYKLDVNLKVEIDYGKDWFEAK